jgi:hypothetical protein
MSISSRVDILPSIRIQTNPIDTITFCPEMVAPVNLLPQVMNKSLPNEVGGRSQS